MGLTGSRITAMCEISKTLIIQQLTLPTNEIRILIWTSDSGKKPN